MFCTKMFSKISVLCVAALAIVAQAKHERHHTHSHKNGTLTHHPFPDYDRKPSASGGYHVEAGMSSGVAPQPGYPLLSTGASSRLLTTGVPVPTYLTTGFPTPTQSGDTTLTYVIGTGSSTTTVVTTIHHTSYRTSYKVITLHFNSISKTATDIQYLRLSARRYNPPFTSLMRLLLVAGLAALLREPPLTQSVRLPSLLPSLDLRRPSLW